MHRMPPYRRGQDGSVLLLSLLVTGLIATLALSFASSMGTKIQVARDQAATLHADLAAQSGLEYAQRRLFIDPLWDGTMGAPLLYADGTTFSVVRREGKASAIMPSEVSLIVEGIQSASKARFETLLLVNPGDPLLDKAISVLGDVSGKNIKVEGDYLLLDSRGWMWDFRLDLVAEVQKDSRLNGTDKREYQVKLDTRSDASKATDKQLGYDDDGALTEKLKTLQKVKAKPGNQSRLSNAKNESGTETKSSLTASIEDLLLHVRKADYQVEGVWARGLNDKETFVSLDRIEAQGSLHHFSETLYAWAQNQVKEEQPIHAPGWDFNSLLAPSSRIRIFDDITDVKDLTIPETAVFLLKEGDKLKLKNVHFEGGLVVYVDNGYDYTGDPHNELELSGKNTFGGGTAGLKNIGILAPGGQVQVKKGGAEATKVTGYSVLHSMDDVRRFQHKGVLIILNQATAVIDSVFTFHEVISSDPPETLLFFGDLPGVRVEMVVESFDALPIL